MDTHMLYNLEMSEIEIINCCLTTIINMLIKREWVDNDFDKYYKKIAIIKETNNEIIIENTKKNKIVIKFYNNKLSTIKNDREIENFLNNNLKNHKFLIVNDVNIKAEKQIEELNNLEVFKKNDIIRDVSQFYLVPIHNLLSSEDGDKVISEYSFLKKDMQSILKSDPQVKYLFAQVNDVIQIINNSGGYSTNYRIVI